MKVIDILESLESNSSRLVKEEILETHSTNKLLHRTMIAAYDPYINYFVSKFKAQAAHGDCKIDDDTVVENFLDLIEKKLSTRTLTGNAAKKAVEHFFATLDSRQTKWCTRILLKNLRCGVQDTTINKIWKGSISRFSVQLAGSLASHFVKGSGIVIDDAVNYPVRVEPKLDGLRCVTVKHDGEVTMFTRNGTILETLPTIKSLFEAVPWDNFVLDGEIMGADWNESASVVMSHKKNKDDGSMIYHVFDGMTFEDWKAQSNTDSAQERVKLVTKLVSEVNSERVVQVEGLEVSSQSDLLEFYANCMENGYEGIMIKDLKSPYIFKRSDAVLKLKPITTYEGVIVGNYEGKRGSKREGLWGGFHVVMPNGIITRVAGGFSDALKAEINISPETWIGKIVEVEGQPDPLTKDGLTKDGKVRFPVFIRFRDESDVDPKVMAAFNAHQKNSAN